MSIFKFDSPVMEFIAKVTDFLIITILWIILCIPVFTIGAATTAKYYVLMKIVRGEDGNIIKDYFKSFKENFKQTTVIWLIQLVLIAVIAIDWAWIMDKGLSNTSLIVKIGTGFVSLVVIFVTMTIFPFVARFKVTIKEAFKAAILFSYLKFFKLLLVVILEIITVVAALWYFNWLPAIAIFGFTSAFYFLTVILVKGFKKMEENVLNKEETAEDKESDDEVEDIESDTSKSEESESKTESNEENESIKDESVFQDKLYDDNTVLRPDEHTFKGKFEAEKQTFSELDFKGKLKFFKDYYLVQTILVIVIVLCVGWFFYDAVIDKKDILYTGGLVNCTIGEEGKDILTKDFLDEIKTGKKQEVQLDENVVVRLSEGEDGSDSVQTMAIYSLMATGYYNYFFIENTSCDYYLHSGDNYKDVLYYADKYNIPDEDRYISVKDEEEAVVAFRLPDDVVNKLGIKNVDGESIYFAFVESTKECEYDEIFLDYLMDYKE